MDSEVVAVNQVGRCRRTELPLPVDGEDRDCAGDVLLYLAYADLKPSARSACGYALANDAEKKFPGFGDWRGLAHPSFESKAAQLQEPHLESAQPRPNRFLRRGGKRIDERLLARVLTSLRRQAQHGVSDEIVSLLASSTIALEALSQST